MTETLRAQQKRLARELILWAVADEIVEKGLDNLSLQQVATRAGVSNRTLYNYFENREALLNELGRFSDELTVEFGGFTMPESLETLPSMVPAVWNSWEAQGSVYQAVLQISMAGSIRDLDDGRRDRKEALTDAVSSIRPDLEPAEQHAIGSLLHAIASSAMFGRLTTVENVDTQTAGQVAAWLLTLINKALAQGEDPFHQTFHDTEEEA